jgi:hypothetical protein
MTSIPKKPHTPTSSKPTVMVLEGVRGMPVDKDPHSHNVARSVQRVLPEDNPVGISFRQVSEPKETFQYNRIPVAIENSFLSQFKEFTESLNDIGKLKKSQRPNAVNASFGRTKFTVLTDFKEQPELFFKMATQAEKTSLFDLQKEKKATKYVWKLPELESYIDTTLDKSPKITEAKKKAEDAVEALKQKNVAVVVAAGNLNDDIEAFKKEHPDVQFESDEGQSIFALKNTITVGASNADGTLTDYSSRGTEVDFTTQIPPSIKKRGTSYTAPTAAGMVAFLTAQGYTVDEAKDLLKNWGTAKQDEFGNSYTDLNLADVQKKLAQLNQPTSKEKK